MKNCLVLVALVAVSVPGQWLETTIPLRSDGICYNPIGDKVYSLGEYPTGGTILTVIDGATNQVVDTVWIDMYGPGSCLCHNSVSNKLYCTYVSWPPPSGGVAVLDCVEDTVIAGIWTPGGGCLCYNDSMNKVYCGGYGVLSVIDGGSDSIIDSVPLAGGCGDLCYNPQNNKVYCTSRYSDLVTVIDCTADTVLAQVPVGHQPGALCYNPQNNKVYCANWQGHTVTVVDGAGDSVIATVDARWCPVALCYNSRSNKVYCANQSTGNVTVIDGESDSTVATVEVGFRPAALCCDPGNNKVYCANCGSNSVPDSTVTVLDGETDSVLVTITVGRWPSTLCHNPQHSRVYVGSPRDSALAVIRDSMPGGIAENKAEGARMKAEPERPTVLRGPELARLDCRVLDALGRDVTEQKHGLRPGIYFLREAGRRARVSKVIVPK